MTVFARTCFAISIATAALFNSLSGWAQEFPSKTVRILVPYAAGGGSDTAARLVIDPLSKHLGVAVYVDNRGGGGGLNGTEAFFSGDQDGYTILMAAVGPTAIIPAGKTVSYSVEKDFVPLGQVWLSAQALAVRNDLGTKTMAEFVAYAKANPGKLTIGSAGFGTLTHLAIELLKRQAGIDVTHVPFRSGGAILPSILGGHIDGLFADATTLAPNVQAGTLTALAVASPRRSPALPDLVTMSEAGFPGVEAESWNVLVVGARTPAPVVTRLQAAVLATQKDPSFLASIAKLGISAGEPGPEPLRLFLKDEIAKWSAIVKGAGIKFE